MKKRIGIITHNYPTNSNERKDAGIFIYDFAHELSKKADVFVLCPDFGGKKEKYKKVPVTWFNWGGGSEKFGNWQLYNPIYVYKFFRLIFVGQKEAIKFSKENKLDYCLACWTLPSAVLAWRVKHKVGTPYAAWSLGSDVNKYVKIPILSQLIYLSLTSADKLFANSFALAKKVKKITDKECQFMPAITDFKLKKISNPKLDKKCFNFLFVGRLESVKGPDILIDAVSLLKKENSSFTVNILGGGSMMTELQKKVLDLNLKDQVNFVGWASEATVGGFMKASDCLVISSRNESLPLVAIEAAKTGLPFIATDVGDCKRLIKDYRVGEVVKREEPAELASAMLRALKEKDIKKIYRKGMKKMTNDFQQKRAVETFLK